MQRRTAALVLSLAALAACDPTPTESGRATPRLDAGAPSPLNLAGARSGGGPLLSRAPLLELGTGADGIITNGTIKLGVNPTGNLDVGGGSPSAGTFSTTNVGLRYLPTNGEATAPGCLCEGWGVADGATGAAGYANVAVDGVVGMTVESATFTASEYTSVVNVRDTMRVTHRYRPAPETPNLYRVDVTIENITATPIADLRYRRVFDFDVPPNTFNEFITIQGSAAATDVLFAGNDGFASANPLAARQPGLVSPELSGDFVDAGPQDQGALFDFGFGALAPGATKKFTIYYGAASTESDALAALGAVGAEVYAFGQANWDGVGDPTVPRELPLGLGAYGRTTGGPATFVFAFGGVGGVPVVNAPPTANAGADVTKECAGTTTSVALDGSASTDADGTIVSWEWREGASLVATGATPTVALGPGTHTLTLTVTDDKGATGTDDVVVKVVDTTAPTVSLAASPGTLWPPNHKYVAIDVAAAVSDACKACASLTFAGSVVSSEADDAIGTGDGSTTGDVKVTKANGTVLLSSNASPSVPFDPRTDRLEVRAERFGTAAPRVYTIRFTATDCAGNTTTRTATVTVAHDQGP